MTLISIYLAWSNLSSCRNGLESGSDRYFRRGMGGEASFMNQSLWLRLVLPPEGSFAALQLAVQ